MGVKIAVFFVAYLLDIVASNILVMWSEIFMAVGIFCAIKLVIYSYQGLNKILG
ncbi:MAG: hypothetical protein AAB632_02785 [Patescibacteria group bacterium]